MKPLPPPCSLYQPAKLSAVSTPQRLLSPPTFPAPGPIAQSLLQRFSAGQVQRACMRNQGLHIPSHWGQRGNEPSVAHAYDFLLMLHYIWKHNVIISLWPSRPIRERKGSVFQSHLSQSQQRCAELCCLNWFKQYSRDCQGVSLSSEVSQGPHVIFFSDHQNGNERRI